MKTRISVIMPSYQHGAYIAQAIGSVLAQTIEEIELIVIDDGSPDHSNHIIRGFTDRRIVHIPLPVNVGASEAMNIGLRAASGPLIAVCNSDDLWERDKLRRQLEILDHAPNIAAVFSHVSWIDSAGAAVDDSLTRAIGNFAQENRSRHAWLRRLVEGGNCLCHSSVLIRREIYQARGFYDAYLRQLPDYDMWLRILQHHDIHVMPDRLVRFRVHDTNTSRGSPQVWRRDARERLFILRKLFDEMTAGTFRQVFLGDETGACEDRCLADPRAVIAYLNAYEGPMISVFQDIMLEKIYRAEPEIRAAVLPALDFQRAMAQPLPAFMSECPAKPSVEMQLLRRIRCALECLRNTCAACLRPPSRRRKKRKHACDARKSQDAGAAATREDTVREK